MKTDELDPKYKGIINRITPLSATGLTAQLRQENAWSNRDEINEPDLVKTTDVIKVSAPNMNAGYTNRDYAPFWEGPFVEIRKEDPQPTPGPTRQDMIDCGIVKDFSGNRGNEHTIFVRNDLAQRRKDAAEMYKKPPMFKPSVR